MQEIRRFKPSTVSRRFSVVAGFYRTAVIDGALDHSPAEHVRRPAVPPESPTLGFTHLQFEAILTASRESASPYDYPLVAMLGLLGDVHHYSLSGMPSHVRRSPVTCAFRTGRCVRDHRWDTRRLIRQRFAVSTCYRGEQCATTSARLCVGGSH